MKISPSFLESLGSAIAAKVVSLVLLLGSFAIAFPFIFIAEKTKIGAFRVIGGVVFIFSLIASILASREIVTRMANDKSMPLSLAVAHTWYHYLLYLAFIPFVGPFFQRFVDRKKKNPFLADRQ